MAVLGVNLLEAMCGGAGEVKGVSGAKEARGGSVRQHQVEPGKGGL